MSKLPPFGNLAPLAFRQPKAENLCVRTPCISADDTNADVLDVFSRHRDLVCLPVEERGRPIGLINRNIFMSQMSQNFHREIYDRKSCIAFMDKSPLIVEAETSIEDLAKRAVESGAKALADGFIVVRDGQFAGLGSGIELLRFVVELQAEKNHQIMQSIEYASVIQQAMLDAASNEMQETLGDAGLVWEPRDVVAGDFYHFAATSQGWFFGLGDCTGHGVPGAFLTTIAASSLKQAIQANGTRDPAQLLGAVNVGIKQALGQLSSDATGYRSNEGMDAGFVYFDNATRALVFAGARIPLFCLQPGTDTVTVIDGARNGLGYVDTALDATWTSHRLELAKGATVWVMTDGLFDQVGGPKNIAYGKRRIKELMLAHRDKPVKAMLATLMAEHKAYQGEQSRRDDLTVFGFRVQ